MAEQDRGSDDPQLAAAARHALHDEELVAAYAAGDLEGTADLERAQSFVERCATCRDLHTDLSAIRAATQASGTAAERAATRSAPRDFRLSAEDAARLRPGSPIKRLAVRLGWRERLGLGIAAFGRPVGAALTTFGVVGLLVGSLTLGGAAPFAAMSGGPASSAAPGVDQSRSGAESLETLATGLPPTTGKSDGPWVADEPPPSSSAPSAVLWGGSIAFLVLGLGLIVAARRSRPVPRGN